MNRNIVFLASVLIGAVISFTSMKVANYDPGLEIGSEAPLVNRMMAGVNDQEVSLSELKDNNGLLVIFSCNTCPFVVGNGSKEGWEGRYNGIYDVCLKNGIGMVLVNSNEAKRPGDDSMDEMKKHAEQLGYKMPYVVDKDHKLADEFGARTTPHVFLFNNEMKLVYRGLIDDNVNSAKEVKEEYLNNALNALKDGKLPDPASTKAMGCSIKRVG